MKRLPLFLAVLVACSGQMCGLSGSSSTNSCDRDYTNGLYGMGFDLPPNATGPTTVSNSSGTAPALSWNWPDPEPDIQFELFVMDPVAGAAIQDYKQTWLDQLTGDGAYSVYDQSFFELRSGDTAWYLALNPAGHDEVIVEMMFIVKDDRLVYLQTVYDWTTVDESLSNTIGETLFSLCGNG